MKHVGGPGLQAAVIGGALALSLSCQAAAASDVPAKPSASVDYVRICSREGTGFFVIPGTETCLKLAGRVRAEMRYLEPGTREDDAFGTRARGRIDLDARTATAYGNLRTFVRYEFTRNTGSYGESTAELDRAFVSLAGVTAGRTQSYFDFYTNDYNFGSILVSDFPTQVLAYTVERGSGFSASLALEDGTERQFYNRPNGPDFPGQDFSAAGVRVPDLVGQLLLERDWGKAQLSGALRQIRSDNLVPDGATTAYVGTDYGFAVQGGV